MLAPPFHSTISDIAQVLLGDVVLALCFFTPGYLSAAATNIMDFRRRSIPEKVLWSIALSGPLSILLTCIVARALPATAIVAIVVAAGIAGLLLFFRDLLTARRKGALGLDRSFWIIAATMAVVAIYCVAATLGIQTHHHLYESIVSADWSIRVPLVEAAARGPLPPRNPMFDAAGYAPPMRYYYFWYELCALLMRLTHIAPRAALAATTAWSAYSLLSVLLLTIKYLGSTTTLPQLWRGPQSAAASSMRRICVVATGLTCVMSLDLIAAVRDALHHPPILFPDIEAWHADRMPSWAGAILFAPHHVAGVAFGCLGFLLLAVLPRTRRQQILHAIFAAGCFAALAGTSTYLCICFALAGLLLFALRLRQRQWSAVAALVLCAAVALLIAAPFLREMAATQGLSAAGHPALNAPEHPHSLLANSMFKLVLSNWHAAFGAVGDFSRNHGLQLDHGRFRYVFPLFVLPVYFLMELSFYVFVLWYQFKADFRSSPQRPEVATQERRRMLWILFIGFALPGLLLSSEPVQGINDLERHCGLALRLVLIVWAAPMFANVLLRLRPRADRPAAAALSVSGRWVVSLTALMVVIGCGGQLWQIAMDRLYYPLILSGKIESKVQFGTGAPFLQIRRASDAVAAHSPADAIVQDNQDSAYQSLFLLYGQRQFAAGDESCEAAFGGNVDLCRQQIVKPLQRLFGGSFKGRHYEPGEALPEPPDPANMTHEHFLATCRQLHLAVLMAATDDWAWHIPNTWVWREPTLYADDATRVIPCPY